MAAMTVAMSLCPAKFGGTVIILLVLSRIHVLTGIHNPFYLIYLHDPLWSLFNPGILKA
jgi:hypothetical protein